MEKIKVYLQAPLSTSDSLYYKHLLNSPPKTVSYYTNIVSSGIITSKRKFFFNKFFKNTFRNILEKINYPILNLHKTPINDANIIHCAHCLPKTQKNWVADFEAPWQFWVSGRDTKKGKEKFLKIVSKVNCKYLLAWTQEAAKEMTNKFPSIKNKVKVASYAMPFIPSKKIKKKNITLLFSARYFYWKGGLHALEAIHRLTEKYENVYGVIVSDMPEGIKHKYSNNKIQFFHLQPQEKLFKEIYPNSDIFVYPGYSDTFGFGMVGAMNFGLPVVTVDGYARDEIVTEDKTGFVIDKKREINPLIIEEEMVKQLVEKTSLLIENKDLRKRISKNCIEEVKNGKFSIKKRNKKLEKIYNDAIN